MNHSYYLLFTLSSCFIFMTIVAWIAYQKTKGEVSTKEGYFLAGRGLTGTFIAGSMLLTNLSAEQLIGLNGSAFGFNLSAMAWEVTAGFATIVMALVLLPKYLAGAFSTLPEFLNQRYDDSVRRLSVILFMVGYGLITIPSILYSGSIAILRLFDIPELLGWSYELSLVVTIFSVGTLGALYAIFGGLKAVAVSDTLNGIGLLFIGLLIPILGLNLLGQGSISEGLSTLLNEHPEKLNAIGHDTDPVPFATIFTGMILANLFYWGTNQYVIQRTLGAKNLAEGQKGVILSGYFKLLIPFIMMLPGVIAFHLYQHEQLVTIDLAYPQLVQAVLPDYLMGFFLAVLLGAVFSSFNSLLNSAATLFCLDIYLPLKTTPTSDQQLIRVAKIASIVIALFSFIVAPLLLFAPEGLWQIIRIFTGFYNIPVITIVLVGLFTKKVPAIAAKAVIIFHIIAYAILQFVIDINLHFIHLYAVLFIVEVAIMLFFRWQQPRTTPWKFVHKQRVDLTPWRYAESFAILQVGLIIWLYWLFSPWGVGTALGSLFWWGSVGLLFITLSLIYWRFNQHEKKNAKR